MSDATSRGRINIAEKKNKEAEIEQCRADIKLIENDIKMYNKMMKDCEKNIEQFILAHDNLEKLQDANIEIQQIVDKLSGFPDKYDAAIKDLDNVFKKYCIIDVNDKRRKKLVNIIKSEIDRRKKLDCSPARRK